MLREEGIEEIYDGCFYKSGDMVPVGCDDCAGCSDCCRNTGDSIILDPWDLYMLSKGTGKTFSDMIEQEIEIRLVDGLILPNLMQHHEPEPGGIQPEGIRTKNGRGASGKRRSSPAARDGCLFLSAQGRCAIHPYRPGICRLYPLGRYYHTDREFAYIVQKEECTGREKTPVRVREWLGIDDLERYEAYILDWHAFKKSVEKAAACLTDRSRDSVQRYILQIFYVHPYRTEMEFYPQYGARMEVCREALREIL